MNIFIFLLIFFNIYTLNATSVIAVENDFNKTPMKKVYTNLKKGTSCKTNARIIHSIKTLREIKSPERKTRHKIKRQNKDQKYQRSTLGKDQNISKNNLKKDQISLEELRKRLADLQTNSPKLCFKKQPIPCAFPQDKIEEIFTSIKKENENIAQDFDIYFKILCTTETNSNNFIGLVYNLLENKTEKRNLIIKLKNFNEKVKENSSKQADQEEKIKKLIDQFTIYKDADIKNASKEFNKTLDNLVFNLN
ncbi:unnamed protein product [Meloidogyne enterolobii]|uniref:Uncharacterized protein n=1 Tax=Meloidogyne enterolobii TaxID=390850 RepID=A0ACB0Y7J8_MELEN